MFLNMIINDKCNVSIEILKQCRFKTASYVSVCETEHIALPSNVESSDKEIDDFFENFYFAINQPDENKITEHINKKLSKTFATSDPSLVSSYLLEKALNWMKDRKRGALEGVEINEMIQDCLQKVQNFYISSQTGKYRRQLISYGNDHKIKKLFEFLKDQIPQILWLETSEPFPVATMIPATLKAINEERFKICDNYVLGPLSSLIYSQKEISSFYETSAAKDKPFFIIDTGDKEGEADSILEFAKIITTIIENGFLSKLVIISKPNSIFAKEFKHHALIFHEKVSFNDFNKKPSVKFIRLQGKWIEFIKGPNQIQPSLWKELMTYKRVKIGKFIRGKAKNHGQASYKAGRNVNVIELEAGEKRETVKKILNGNAKMKKKLHPSTWVATVDLKNAIQKMQIFSSA